jgi:hypothetical protein
MQNKQFLINPMFSVCLKMRMHPLIWACHFWHTCGVSSGEALSETSSSISSQRPAMAFTAQLSCLSNCFARL